MQEKINKVICLKLQNTNLKFNQNFKNTFIVVKELMNELPCWGLDEIYTKDGKISLKEQRAALYELTDKSISYDQFQVLLKTMYSFFVNCKQGRSLVSIILGNPLCTETIDFNSSEFDDLKTFNEKFDNELMKKYLYKVGNTLKAIGFRNRSPFNIELLPSERYIVIENVHRMFISWNECDRLTKTQYENEQSEINNIFSKIPQKISVELEKFMNFCVNNNIVKYYDSRIRSYIKDCLLPCLLNNTNPKEHFFIIQKNGEKRDFSLHNDFFNYLKENKILWQNSESTEPIILQYLHVLETILEHKNHKDCAFYPIVNDNNVKRFQYYLGKNYQFYKFIAKGNSVKDFTTKLEDKEYEFIDGKNADILNLNFAYKYKNEEENTKNVIDNNFIICLKEKYHNNTFNPSQYFKNLKIWKEKTDNNIHLFEYEKNDEKIRGLVKEPAVIFDGKNYFIRINLSIITTDFDKNLEDLQYLMSSALPNSNNGTGIIKETEQNQKRLKSLNDKSFFMMGVDLGKRTPFTYSFGEYKIQNDELMLVGKMKSGSYNINNMEIKEEYINYKNNLMCVSKIFGKTKKLIQNKKHLILNSFDIKTIEDARKYLKSHLQYVNPSKRKIWKENFIDISNDEICDLNNNLIQKYNNIADLKMNKAWIGNILFTYAKLKFGKIKNERKFHVQKYNSGSSIIDHDYIWIECIDKYKRLTRSLSKLGTTGESIILTKLVNYYNGVKDNLLKVLASKIIKTAHQNNCQIIILEDLNIDQKFITQNSKNENFLQSLWSPKRIQAAIQNAANIYNIKIVNVSENSTSQVHFESGSFGYRYGESLYFENDKGNIDSVDADINASKNILERGITRHGNIKQIRLESIKNIKDESSKRTKGFLTKEFGNVNNAIKSFEKFFGKTNYIYNHKNNWITQEERREIQNRIKTQVENSKNIASCYMKS